MVQRLKICCLMHCSVKELCESNGSMRQELQPLTCHTALLSTVVQAFTWHVSFSRHRNTAEHLSVCIALSSVMAESKGAGKQQ